MTLEEMEGIANEVLARNAYWYRAAMKLRERADGYLVLADDNGKQTLYFPTHPKDRENWVFMLGQAHGEAINY
jgi:hypothetical protein